MNQLQLAINVLEDMIERVDVQAYESPNSEDRVYAGHKWNAFIEARRAILAVLAIDTLAAICRAATPSAPDTEAGPTGTAFARLPFDEQLKLLVADGVDEKFARRMLDGYRSNPDGEIFAQPQPSPAPPLGSETPLQALKASTLKDVSAAAKPARAKKVRCGDLQAGDLILYPGSRFDYRPVKSAEKSSGNAVTIWVAGRNSPFLFSADAEIKAQQQRR